MNILGPNLRPSEPRVERSRLDLHRAEADETLTPLNMLGSRSAERKDIEEEAMPETPEEVASDPLIMGLVARLPKPDTESGVRSRTMHVRQRCRVCCTSFATRRA